jgi:hypothetical protein
MQREIKYLKQSSIWTKSSRVRIITTRHVRRFAWTCLKTISCWTYLIVYTLLLCTLESTFVRKYFRKYFRTVRVQRTTYSIYFMTRKYDTLEGMYVYVYSCTTTLYLRKYFRTRVRVRKSFFSINLCHNVFWLSVHVLYVVLVQYVYLLSKF